MDLAFVHPGGISRHEAHEIDALLGRTDGFTWIDCPVWDEDAERVLAETIGCHPLVISTCRQRNHVPTVHGNDQLFVIVHAPLSGTSGHVHLLELDQIVGRNYLVTVHGPINPNVDPAAALQETDGVRRRIERGRFRPSSPAEMSFAIGSAIARRQRGLVGEVAERLPELEQQVMASDLRQPEALLERLFLLRHELLTARTMAAQSHDVYARVSSLERFIPDADKPFAKDLVDQFDRVRSIADGESQFLFGVIDLYQTEEKQQARSVESACRTGVLLRWFSTN